MMYLRVFLKVCQGCGGLWLRAENGSEVYCLPGVRKLSKFPQVRDRRKVGRPGKHSAAAGGAR
jgi:hypothetical protein